MKIGSYRIEPGEIEAVLSLCASVSESLILCAENAGQKFLAAYVVRKDDSLSTSELAAFLRARLPVYMIPSRFIFLESFPKTINGKIDRRALPPVESGAVDRAGEYQEAESELERELASIWSNVLNISKIGRFDDFFQLGGSSLLVTRVIAQLTGKLNLAIPVRDFFANPTIASLSQHLRLLTQTEKSTSSDEEKKLRQANAIALRRKLPTIEPLTIASRSEQLAAVQYPSVGINGMRRNHTIVMCNAMGHEATRANRNLQQLAIRLSQDGFDVVRFDFASTGNSTGRAADATLDQWRSDIAAVVQKIRCEPMFEPSTHNVSLLGIRLGATLLAQTPLTGIDKAILWDPILCGQDYLNMLRSMHRFELESLTRYLTFRKGQPEQLMGSAYTATMQQEIAAIQLCESTRIQSLTRWVVETKRYGVRGQPALSLPGWQHTQSEDEIYWEAKEFSQSSFSSPHSSRLIASIFAKGGV
jgi:pimeloyl-ACP methyl ester carboxylesterase